MKIITNVLPFLCLGMGYNGQPIYSEIKLITDSEEKV